MKVLCIWVGATCAAILTFVAYLSFVPSKSVIAPLGNGDTVEVREWLGIAEDGYFDIIVTTAKGISRPIPLISSDLIESRFNIYRQPNGIVIITNGGFSFFINMSEKNIPFEEKLYGTYDDDSFRWEYIGTVVEIEENYLNYHPAAEISECIPLLGAGSSPYRVPFQKQSRCSDI